MPQGRCNHCHKLQYKDAFHPSQWKREEKLCKECQNELKTEVEYECSNCHRILTITSFTSTPTASQKNWKCKVCVESEHETRFCQMCKRKKSYWAFGKIEWQNDEARKCRACANKEKDIKPQTGFWKCYGLCKGKAKRHEEFSRSGGIYTGHQRCNACIESQEMDEAVQANKCHSEVVISEKTTANERTKRKQQDDDTFTTNVKHVHEWRNKHKGSWPNTHSNDAHERFLGNFLHQQRKNLIKQTLTEKRRKQLEKIPGFACAQREQQWNDKYLQLCAWVAKQKSEAVLPTRHSADPEEKKLGI